MDMERICIIHLTIVWYHSKPEFDKHVISQSRNFVDYIEIVQRKDIHFDVLINNGRCRPQVAYKLRNNLREDGLMILRGSREHYSIIDSFYSLETQ